jgi:hypothetical protein
MVQIYCSSIMSARAHYSCRSMSPSEPLMSRKIAYFLRSSTIGLGRNLMQ